MLADAVEAASRTLTERTQGRFQGLVGNIVNTIFTDGELNECELTLRELHLIEESFVRGRGQSGPNGRSTGKEGGPLPPGGVGRSPDSWHPSSPRLRPSDCIGDEEDVMPRGEARVPAHFH